VKWVTLEVAVTTADEAQRAVAAGADRLELCSALELGGVTPSPGTFLEVRATVPVPVYVLLRPRPGGFVYSDAEFATIKRDAEWMLANGADGIVCGVLTADGRIDRARCAELIAIASRDREGAVNPATPSRSRLARVVFHRAFDFLPDLPVALDELIGLGFERVLTSGGAATATDGQAIIAELVRRADRRIGILPGGGIRPDNVAELLRETGCDQVHASLRGPVQEPLLAANRVIGEQMGGRFTTDAELVREMRAVLDRYTG
jgi:copper homeostasis protein